MARRSLPIGGRLRASGAAAIVLLLVAGVVFLTRGPKPDGPLTADGRVSVHFPLQAGQTGTWGMVLPTNPTVSDITIDSIEAVNPQGLQVVGMLVNNPDVDGGVGGADVFPPPGIHAHSVTGAVIGPAGSQTTHLQVLIGVQLVSTEGTIESLRVQYEFKGSRYELVLPFDLRIFKPPD